MNSWKIIKSTFTEGRPNTIGRHIEINHAAKIFVALQNNLNDWDEACEVFNADEEVFKAIANKRTVDEMKQAGIL
jgi:hypothetical protein